MLQRPTFSCKATKGTSFETSRWRLFRASLAQVPKSTIPCESIGCRFGGCSIISGTSSVCLCTQAPHLQDFSSVRPRFRFQDGPIRQKLIAVCRVGILCLGAQSDRYLQFIILGTGTCRFQVFDVPRLPVTILSCLSWKTSPIGSIHGPINDFLLRFQPPISKQTVAILPTSSYSNSAS